MTVSGKAQACWMTKLEFKFDDLTRHTVLMSRAFIVDGDMAGYDMIIGQNVLRSVKADVNFSTNTVSVGEYSVPFVKVEVPVHEVHADQEEAKRVLNKGKELLEAKYEPADLDEVVAKATALNPDQKKGL